MEGISSQAAKGLVYQPNNKKFNGIEETRDLGLNQYDAFYRNLDPQIGRWFQIDPKSHLYYSYSPYTEVGNNPMNISDPLGDKWKNKDDEKRAQGIVKELERKEEKLRKKQSAIQDKWKAASEKGDKTKAEKYAKQNVELINQVYAVHNAANDISNMALDKTTTFEFMSIDQSAESTTTQVDSKTGNILIPILSDLGSQAHELTHGSDLSTMGLVVKNNTGNFELNIPDFIRESMEIKSYKTEYAVNGAITEQSFAFDGGDRIKSINDINGYYIAGIYDINPSNKKRDMLYPDILARYSQPNKSGKRYNVLVK